MYKKNKMYYNLESTEQYQLFTNVKTSRKKNEILPLNFFNCNDTPTNNMYKNILTFLQNFSQQFNFNFNFKISKILPNTSNSKNLMTISFKLSRKLSIGRDNEFIPVLCPCFAFHRMCKLVGLDNDNRPDQYFLCNFYLIVFGFIYVGLSVTFYFYVKWFYFMISSFRDFNSNNLNVNFSTIYAVLWSDTTTIQNFQSQAQKFGVYFLKLTSFPIIASLILPCLMSFLNCLKSRLTTRLVDDCLDSERKQEMMSYNQLDVGFLMSCCCDFCFYEFNSIFG